MWTGMQSPSIVQVCNFLKLLKLKNKPRCQQAVLGKKFVRPTKKFPKRISYSIKNVLEALASRTFGSLVTATYQSFKNSLIASNTASDFSGSPPPACARAGFPPPRAPAAVAAVETIFPAG